MSSLKTTFLAAIAATALVSGAGCKKTASEATGGQPTALDKGNSDIADARTMYIAAAKERLAKVDAKIDELAARTDAESKEAAAKLRTRRDQIAARLDTMAGQASSSWTNLKQDIDQGADAIEKDIDRAVK